MRSTSDEQFCRAQQMYSFSVSQSLYAKRCWSVGVAWEFDGGPGKVRFMLFSVNREGAEKLLGLVEGFFDGEGPVDPVDCGVDFFQPRES